MRRSLAVVSCALVASLALLAGCPGSKTSGGGGGTTTANNPPKGGELDKLMRTRMNASYSQLVFLVFHAEGDTNFESIEQEGSKLTEAIAAVLALQPPLIVQSEQAKGVYVDYNNTLKKDNDRFVEATSRRDIQSMSTSLSKIGETCSACHHFFRVSIKDAAE